MLHLFKKVYIEFDTRMSVAHDRVVISEEMGVPMDDELVKISGGTLINYATSVEEMFGENGHYSSLVDMFVQLAVREETTNKTCLIFVDEKSFLHVVVPWFKMLLPNITAKEIQQIIESYVHRQEMFSNAKFSLSDIEAHYDNAELIEMPRIQEFFDNETAGDQGTIDAFMDMVDDAVGIEYLFASYLYDGSHKEELKKRMKPLLTKDVEKYLYELKEILLVHTLNLNLQSLLEMNKIYTFDNLNEIENETAPLVKVFFDPRLWTRPGLQTESSSGTIKFENFTAEDIENIREFGKRVGTIWEEEKFYTLIKSDIMKLDFIPFLSDAVFTDEHFEKMIDFELAKEHATGSYNAISQRTVNNYLVDHVIFAHKNNDKDAIKPFTL